MTNRTRSIKLAFRDVDRLPVIWAIKEMARQHYDLDVDAVSFPTNEAFEESIFNGESHVLIEHLEYLWERVSNGSEILFFAAPVIETGLELVVRPEVNSIDDLRGGKLVIRLPGRPHAALMRLRHIGLLDDVELVHIHDREIGRWQQWKKVLDGDCGAAWISTLYLPAALEAGLKVLDVPNIDVVSHYAQACLRSFPKDHPEIFDSYLRAMLHGLSLIRNEPDAAFEIAMGEPMRRIGIEDRVVARRAFDAITEGVRVRPYPTDESLKNSAEIAIDEFPTAAGVNLGQLWDLTYVREIDDSGFIDGLKPS